MNVFSINAFVFTIYLITPGIVALWFHDMIVASEKRDLQSLLLGLLSYSAPNLLIYALISPLIQRIWPPFSISLPVLSLDLDGRTLLFEALIIPAFLGCMGGLLPRQQWFRRLFRGNIHHPDPTAWDHAFANPHKCYTVIFHMKSGQLVVGIYGDKSFVSTYPQPKDIYVEQLCEIDEQGNIGVPIDKSAGAFISMEECQYCEFIDITAKRSQTWQTRMKESCKSLMRWWLRKILFWKKVKNLLPSQTLVVSKELEPTERDLLAANQQQQSPLPLQIQKQEQETVQVPLSQTQPQNQNLK